MQYTSDNPKSEEIKLSERRRLAEAIRQACLEAALAGYEDASISGLCHEGAWECAVDAIRSLNINVVIEQMLTNSEDGAAGSPGSSLDNRDQR